jgi:hypothetical protein
MKINHLFEAFEYQDLLNIYLLMKCEKKVRMTLAHFPIKPSILLYLHNIKKRVQTIRFYLSKNKII